jgi:hypothetical protein
MVQNCIELADPPLGDHPPREARQQRRPCSAPTAPLLGNDDAPARPRLVPPVQLRCLREPSPTSPACSAPVPPRTLPGFSCLFSPGNPLRRRLQQELLKYNFNINQLPNHVLPILMNKIISPTRTACNSRIGPNDSNIVDGFLELQFLIY